MFTSDASPSIHFLSPVVVGCFFLASTEIARAAVSRPPAAAARERDARGEVARGVGRARGMGMERHLGVLLIN